MTQTRERSLGLDLLRLLALIMISIGHYTRYLPGQDVWIRSIQFGIEVGTAYFFFAFGMTSVFFLHKDRDEQIRRLAIFFLLGMCHSMYMKETPLTTEFFLFLCLWQMFLMVLDVAKARLETLSAGIILLSSALLLIPHSVFDLNRFFEHFLSGPFPLLPWGMYVLAGFIYQRLKEAGRLPVNELLLALGFFVLWGVAFLLHWATGAEVLETTKWYLSFPYVLMSTGVVMAILYAGVRLQAWYQRPSPVRDTIAFLSEYLLLAVVLHYIPLMLIQGFTNRLGEAFVGRHNVLFLVTAVVLLNVSVYVLVRIAVYAARFIWRVPVSYLARFGLSVLMTLLVYHLVYIQRVPGQMRYIVPLTGMIAVSILMMGMRKPASRA